MVTRITWTEKEAALGSSRRSWPAGRPPGHHGWVGQLRNRLFTTSYVGGEQAWRLECTLPGWTKFKTRFTTEADAQATAERILTHFTKKLLGEKETES